MISDDFAFLFFWFSYDSVRFSLRFSPCSCVVLTILIDSNYLTPPTLSQYLNWEKIFLNESYKSYAQSELCTLKPRFSDSKAICCSPQTFMLNKIMIYLNFIFTFSSKLPIIRKAAGPWWPLADKADGLASHCKISSYSFWPLWCLKSFKSV